MRKEILSQQIPLVVAEMLLFVAHPDDEVIFFAPLLELKSSIYQDLDEKSYGNLTVVCMTCEDDPIRFKEFTALASHVGYRAAIYDTPIVRGLSFENYFRILKRVQSYVSSDTKECATHSLYGDDHFHPQHVLLSIAVTYVCIRQGVRVIVADCSCSAAQLFLRALKRTDWRRLKSIALLPFKFVLIIAHKLVFTSSKLYQAEQSLLDSASLIYASQSLEYPSFVDNLYRFSSLRNIWRSKTKLVDKI